MKPLALALLFAASLAAQDRWYLASVTAYSAGSMMDYASSLAVRGVPGARELNPLLTTNGRFDATKGAAAKLMVAGLTFTFEQWLRQRYPSKRLNRTLIVTNFAAGAVFAGIGANNLKLRGAK